MVYKNTSRAVKTFYGIEFKPGESHNVDDYINDPKLILCDEDVAADTQSVSKLKSSVKEAKSDG